MRRHAEIPHLPFAVLLVLCLAGSSFGQKPKSRKLERANNTAKEVRQSFEQGQADGLNVIIYQFTAKGMVAVDPRKAFRSGDRFRLRLQSNFDGYVYVVNVTPGGESRLLFPLAQSRGNNVRASQYYYIPAGHEFQFNDEAGVELLQILMSRSRVSFLDAALDRAPKRSGYLPLDKPTVRSWEQLAGKPVEMKSSGITARPAPPRPGIQTRKLILDRKKETTFVVVAGGKETPSRFQSGEVSVFEVRLNHY